MQTTQTENLFSTYNYEKFNRLQKKEQVSRIYLNPNKPVIIRFDGKDITKDHKNYPLTATNGFTYHAFLSGIHLLEDMPGKKGIVYAGLDEVSIAFTDPMIFWHSFEDSNKDYAMSVLVQRFVKYFYKYYPEVLFGVSMFNVDNTEDIYEYIHIRQMITSTNAITYLAKDFLPKEEYHDLSTDDILKNLTKTSPEAISWMTNNPWFQNGYCKGLGQNKRGL